MAAETGELAEAAMRLRATVGTAASHYIEKQPATTGHITTVLVAVIVGMAAAHYARAQGTYSTTLTLALGSFVASLIINLPRAIYKTNFTVITSMCFRALVMLLTVTLRALTLAIERAHLLTALLMILCVLVHGVYGIAPLSKNGDGGALCASTLDRSATTGVRRSSTLDRSATTGVRRSFTLNRSATMGVRRSSITDDSTLDRSATTGVRRSLAVGMTFITGDSTEARGSAGAVGMTHNQQTEPLDDGMSAGATLTDTEPLDATGAEANSTPIEVTNIAMA